MLNRFALPMTFAAATLAVFAAILFSSFLSKNKLDTQAQVDHFEELNTTASATFTPNHSNLNILLISLKNPGLADTGTYTLKLYSGTSVLRELRFSGQNVGDPTDLKFQFAPITDSKNVSLKLTLESSAKSQLKVGVARGQLAITSYYKNQNPITLFISSISNLVSRILSDPGFLLVWLGTTGILLGCTRLRIFRYN